MRAQPAKPAKTISTPAFVGVLDSGVGGLSVLREIHRLLPDTPTLYYADQAHLPYGPRPASEICHFVEVIADFLIEQGAALIVLACHSASAAALERLRKRCPEIPIVGIEPAVKPAAEATRTGVIGVLTTQATADGALYRRVVARYAANVRVITRVSPELVTMVEQGSRDEAILRTCIEPLLEAGADQIVLACTHFPFLKASLQQITDVTLVDPGAAVARQTRRVLPPSVHAEAGINRYYTSGSPEQLQAMLKELIGVDAEVGDGLKV
ncbi:MAG: glutamate racemase [Chloroflexota bacterium]